LRSRLSLLSEPRWRPGRLPQSRSIEQALMLAVTLE
jgi:hypothetical protein